VTDFHTPPEQVLDVQDMHAVLTAQSDNPPELLLTLDVQHVETKHSWRLAQHFSRDQLIELTHLLVYICNENDIDWNPL